MKNLVDKNGRTIWFHGLPGKLTPANAKSRVTKTTKKKNIAKQHVKVDPDHVSGKNHTMEKENVKSEYIDTIKKEGTYNTTKELKKECNGINIQPTKEESKECQNYVTKKRCRKSRTSQQNI